MLDLQIGIFRFWQSWSFFNNFIKSVSSSASSSYYFWIFLSVISFGRQKLVSRRFLALECLVNYAAVSFLLSILMFNKLQICNTVKPHKVLTKDIWQNTIRNMYEHFRPVDTHATALRFADFEQLTYQSDLCTDSICFTGFWLIKAKQITSTKHVN